MAGVVYFSGYADDVAEWFAKRYYKAKALAEVKVMENVGEERVQGMVKGRSSNPLSVGFSCVGRDDMPMGNQGRLPFYSCLTSMTFGIWPTTE